MFPALSVQAMHELDPPRRYRTVFVCGAFGLGSTRAQDAGALRRFHDVLESGGTLLLDIEVPYANADQWQHWTSDGRRALRDDAEPPGERRRRASDGSEYVLRSRLVDLDPLNQRVTLVNHAERWREGKPEAEEDRTLTINLYFRNELLLMLERAGFTSVEVPGDHHDRPATADDDFLVFVAKKG